MKNISHFLAVLLFVSAPMYLSAQNYFHEKGKASFYADKFEGRLTASGEKFKQSKMTAAHNTLPFGTKVKVTNKNNGKIRTVHGRIPFM